MFRRKKLEADEILISMQDFYELNLTIFWKGLGGTKRFLLIIYLDIYSHEGLEKDNGSLSIARGLIGSERRSGPEKEELEEWVETR